MVDHTARLDAVVTAPPFSRISWGSIIAGTLCAFALQLLFNMIGVGIGLAATDFREGADAFASIGIGAGIWWGVSAIISLVIGGWIAGRLAGVPLRTAAALHGASVWALATILTVWLATSTVATAVSGAFGAVGTIGQATAGAVSGSVSALGQEGSALLSDARNNVNSAGQQRQSVMRSIRDEVQSMYSQVVSPQEQQAAVDAVQQTAGDIARNPGDTGRELSALVDRLFSNNGVFSDEDRQQALNLLQQRFGLSQQEAEQMIQNWQDRYQAAVNQVQESLQNLKQEATQAAESAADAVGKAAGWTSLALALGLIAAVIGGILGKPEPWAVEAMEEEEARTA